MEASPLLLINDFCFETDVKVKGTTVLFASLGANSPGADPQDNPHSDRPARQTGSDFICEQPSVAATTGQPAVLREACSGNGDQGRSHASRESRLSTKRPSAEGRQRNWAQHGQAHTVDVGLAPKISKRLAC